MILVGQYDSPFVRRVAVSLRVLGFDYEHDTRSVFGDFEAMRQVNPLGRIPSLVLDGGEVLIDSAAILDWLDETVGPDRALLPRRRDRYWACGWNDCRSSRDRRSRGRRRPGARSSWAARRPGFGRLRRGRRRSGFQKFSG